MELDDAIWSGDGRCCVAARIWASNWAGLAIWASARRQRSPHNQEPPVSNLQSAVVIGTGNVALDVARICKVLQELAA